MNDKDIDIRHRKYDVNRSSQMTGLDNNEPVMWDLQDTVGRNEKKWLFPIFKFEN